MRSRAALVLLVTGLAAGCAATTARPAAFPGAPVPSAVRSAALLTARRQAIVDTALTLRGIPYRLGGMDPDLGFDCSGLVQYVFARHDVDVPRTVIEQYREEPSVRGSHAETGDLVFFAVDSREPTHVGIAIDDHQFVHAPGTGRAVRLERFDTPYWQSRLKGIRRPSYLSSSGD